MRKTKEVKSLYAGVGHRIRESGGGKCGVDVVYSLTRMQKCFSTVTHPVYIRVTRPRLLPSAPPTPYLALDLSLAAKTYTVATASMALLSD